MRTLSGVDRCRTNWLLGESQRHNQDIATTYNVANYAATNVANNLNSGFPVAENPAQAARILALEQQVAELRAQQQTAQNPVPPPPPPDSDARYSAMEGQFVRAMQRMERKIGRLESENTSMKQDVARLTGATPGDAPAPGGLTMDDHARVQRLLNEGAGLARRVEAGPPPPTEALPGTGRGRGRNPSDDPDLDPPSGGPRR